MSVLAALVADGGWRGIFGFEAEPRVGQRLAVPADPAYGNFGSWQYFAGKSFMVVEKLNNFKLAHPEGGHDSLPQFLVRPAWDI